MASSFLFARESGLRLLLYWVPGDGCWCPFADLFEPHVDFDVVATPPSLLRKVLPPWIGKEADWLARQIPKAWHARWLASHHGLSRPFDMITGAEIESGGGTLPRLHDKSALIFRNVLAFRPLGWTLPQYESAMSAFLRSLIPAPAVRAKLKELPPGTIGVHARRGDNARAAACSTTEAFMAAIAERLSDRPAARLFVASDNEDFVAAVRAVHHDIVLTREHVIRDRHQPEGIRDALADLLTLSRCEEILGSAHSSFSECAAAFHGVRLRKVGI